MKIRKNFNPFEISEKEAYSVYSNVVGLPNAEVQRFLRDVGSLDGKLPDGKFTRPIPDEASSLLDGFSGDSLNKYMAILPGFVRERVDVYLDRYDDHDPESVRGIRCLTPESGRKEMNVCRELAILGTLKEMIPGFEDLFEAKPYEVYKIYKVLLQTNLQNQESFL